MKGSTMKKEYNLDKMTKRKGKVKVVADANKVAISLRLDSSIIAGLREEAQKLGLPYQTLISSILHQYLNGELISKKNLDILKSLNVK